MSLSQTFDHFFYFFKSQWLLSWSWDNSGFSLGVSQNIHNVWLYVWIFSVLACRHDIGRGKLCVCTFLSATYLSLLNCKHWLRVIAIKMYRRKKLGNGALRCRRVLNVGEQTLESYGLFVSSLSYMEASLCLVLGLDPWPTHCSPFHPQNSIPCISSINKALVCFWMLGMVGLE